MRVVIDHLSGTRRGQRQELSPDARVRFGRHPECEVSFDAVRDIDASSRHAELRPPSASQRDHWVLVDVGSSNGTFVDGHRITEAPIQPGHAVVVALGPDGPRLRLFVGDDLQLAQLPPIEPPPRRRVGPVIVVAVALAVVAIAAALFFAL